MSQNLKQKYTVELNLEVKTAEAQVKKLATNINNIWADMGKASNKFAVLKDLADYLELIDSKIADLKGVDINLFNKIFGTDGANISAALKQTIEPILKSPELIADAMKMAQSKLTAIQGNQKAKGTADDIREIAGAINQMYKLIGQAPPIDIDAQLKGGKVKEKLALLTKHLDAFEVEWKEILSTVNAGRGMDRIGDTIGAVSDEAQSKINKLKGQAKEFKEILDIFNDQSIKSQTTKKNGAGILNSLEDELLQATADLEKLEAAGDVYGDKYKKTVAKVIKSATLLINTTDYEQQYGGKNAQGKVEELKTGGDSSTYNIAKQYLDKIKKSNVFTDVQEYFKQQMQLIGNELTAMGVNLPEFGSYIDAQSNVAVGGFQRITQSANETSKAVHKVMYHLGNLLSGKSGSRDTFGDMLYNLTDAVADDSKYNKYGFGVLGGGLFGVSDPSTIDTQTVNGGKFLHAVDLSKYNMYIADTEERATNLMDFLSKIQKYAIKSAEPNYTGFDEHLDGVNIDTLYDQFGVVFAESDMTKEKLNTFLNEMVDLLRQAGLKFDAETEELYFDSADGLEASDNISTRLMKKLGYQGVNVGGTSFDGMGQGSVLFDFNENDIVGYFSTLDNAIEDFQKRINGVSWDGTNEQLKQYRSEIDSIIARLEKYKSKYKDASQYDTAISRLSQIQTNIDDILAGKRVDANGPFKTVTGSMAEDGSRGNGAEMSATQAEVKEVTDAVSELREENQKLQQELSDTKSELRASDAVLSEVIGEKYTLERERQGEVEKALDDWNNLVDTIELGIESPEAANYYEGQLSTMKDYIDRLHELGLVSEDTMSKIESQYRDMGDLVGYQSYASQAANLLDSLRELNDKATLTDDQDALTKIILERQQLIDFAEKEDKLGEDTLETQRAITLEMAKRVGVQEDDYDDWIRENGVLEQRLDILRDIANEYGQNITQKERNRLEELNDKEFDVGLTDKESERQFELIDLIDEADDKLYNFGETYDKIILKFSNGKVKEILPDDAGLRTLARISDELYDNEYDGKEIEDVQFVRQEQYLRAKIESYEELCDVVERFIALRNKERTLKEDREMSAILDRISATKGNMSDDDKSKWNRIFNDFDGVSIKSIADYLGMQNPQTAGSFKQVGDFAIEAATKLKSFSDLTDEIKSKWMRDEMTDIDSGVYTEKLESAKKELEMLGKQGLITVEQLDEVQRAFDEAKEHIGLSQDSNAYKRQYDREGYSYTYEAEYREAESERDNLLIENERLSEEKQDLERQLADAKNNHVQESKSETQAKDVSSEVAQLQDLLEIINKVKITVDEKTAAFRNESAVVDQVVEDEIASLNKLKSAIADIEHALDAAFADRKLNLPAVNTGGVTTAENPHMVTDPQGRAVTMYRGIHDSYGGLVSNTVHPGTFFSDDINVAKGYAGPLGKIEKVLLSMKNPLEIDANGSAWNDIEYIGNGADEVSARLYELKHSIGTVLDKIDMYESAPLDAYDDGFIDARLDALNEALAEYKAELASIYADPTNPYGIKTTNEIVDIAKSKGHDGVIFKNVWDNAIHNYGDESTVMTVFDPEQIHSVETMGITFEDALTLMRNAFGDFVSYIGASEEELRSALSGVRDFYSNADDDYQNTYEYKEFLSDNPWVMAWNSLAETQNLMGIDKRITDDIGYETVIDHMKIAIESIKLKFREIASAFNAEDIPLNDLINGNIDNKQDETNDSQSSNILQNVETVLSQILAVLQGFTGIESDNKNSIKVKEPATDAPTLTSDAYELLANKLPDGIATENTLAAIRGAVEQISSIIATNRDAEVSVADAEDLNSVVNATDTVADNLKDIVYHAGDLSNINNTLKTLPLGNFKPSKMESTFNGFTGLYTTENFEHLTGNEWEGAPISTIDLSHYKMFNARSDELATNVKEFFNDLNSVIYGYLDAFDYDSFDMVKATNTMSIDDLYSRFKQVFADAQIDFDAFQDFVVKAQAVVKGHSFNEVDMPDLDEAASKFGAGTSLQNVSREVFNSDTFQTQLLKMLGYEGIDLRGTKYNSAYTGGTVLFDIKPESIKSVNEKWTDVARREYPESDFWYSPEALEREERRRQIAFDTARAYSQQANSAEEVAQAQKSSLVAMHGLSTQNLMKALTDGAFPAPSIAVTKPEVYSGGYGDATVVFKKSAIDPANNPANKIYGVDAYTPTYPSFGYELNEEGLVKASERTGIAIDKLRSACDNSYENIRQAAEKLAYAAGLGTDFEEAFVKERGFTVNAVEKDEPTQGRFHVDGENIYNTVRDVIAREGITFDDVIRNSDVKKEYFDAIDKYVSDYNSQFEDFPQAKIKDVVVSAFKDRINAALYDKSIYDEEKAIFDHDQAVVRGELKTVDAGAKANEIRRIVNENQAEYINYVEDVLKDAMVKPNVRGANGQRFDRNADGIAAAISSYGGKNALYDEDPFMRRDMDDQLFIIGAAKDYKNIAEVEADAGRLQKDALGTHTKLDNGYIKGLANVVAQANNIEQQEAFDKIVQAVDGDTTAEAIGKALRSSGLTVDDSIVNKIATSAQEAANVNTRYFEAKPQRALGLEDIEFVSVPQGANQLMSLLDSKGIKYVEQDPTDNLSREAAIREGMQKFGEVDVANAREQLQVEQQITAEQREQAAIAAAPPPTPPTPPDESLVATALPPDTPPETAAAGGTPPPDDPNEIIEIERLQEAIENVKKAVNDKTEAFREEGRVVEQVVAQEVAALQRLEDKLTDVKSAVEAKTDAFRAEGAVVNDVASKETSNVDTNENAQIATPAPEDLKPVIQQEAQAHRENADAIREETAAQQDLNAEQQKQVEQPKKATRKKQTPEEKADRTLQLDALTKYRGELRAIMGKGQTSSLDFNYLSEGLRPEQQEIANLYKDTMLQIEEYIDAVKRGEQIEAGSIQNSIALLREKVRVYKDQNNLTDTGKAKKSNRYDGSNAMSTRKAQYNNIQNRIGENPFFANSTVLTDAVSKYEATWSRLQTLYATLQSMPNPTKDDEASFKAASAECNRLGKEVEKLINAYNKMNSDPTKVGSRALVDYNNRVKELQDYVADTHGKHAVIDGFRNNYNELLFTINNGNGTFTKAKVAVDNLRASIVETNGDTEKATSRLGKAWSDLTNKFKGLWTYAAARFGIDEIIQQIRNGVQYVREIDSALTELKKVTNETGATYDAFLQKMSKTAGVVGSTVKDLTTMAAEWARLGYTLEEAGQLAESTAILLNVSEFDDATQASEALISTMQAFQYTADESGHVVDILNEVGNNYAVSSDGIAIALQDSASALMEGGNNLEQATALVAAANRVVQDPSSVGSALRTISLRLRGTSVEVLEEMGEETDGVVESTSKLQEKLKALTGVDILTDAGAYKDTYTILKEIGNVWQDMDSLDQAAALELMAGKNRANTLSAILNNMKDLEGAYKSAMNAEGSAAKENATYLDSIQGRIDLFNNALQTMWMNLLDSDVVKWFVDLGTVIIKAADSFGLLASAAGMFTGIKSTISSIKDEFKSIDMDSSKILNIFKAKPDTSGMKEMADGIEEVTKAKEADIEVTNESIIADEIQEQASMDVDAANKQETGGFMSGVAAKAADTAATIANTAATKANEIATKALAVAKGLVKGALVGLAVSVVTSALSSLVGSIKDAAQRMDELTDSAINSAEELSEAREDVEGYKDEILDLRNSLDSNTLSEKEAYDARAQLIGIQDQLISKFGKEAEGINLVTGAIEDQIVAIDTLAQKKAVDWISKNNEAYQNAIKEVEKTYSTQAFAFAAETTDSTTGDIIRGYGLNSASQDVYDEYIKGITSIIENAGGEVVKDHSVFSEGITSYSTDSFRALFEDKTADELDAIFADIQSFLIDFSTRNGNLDVNAQLNQLANLRSQYVDDDYTEKRELYDSGRQNEAYAKYASEYGKVLDAEKEFYDATTDEERLKAIEKYTEGAADAFEKAGGEIAEDGTWVIDEDSATAHMQDFFFDLNKKFKGQEFELKVKTNEDELQSELETIVNKSGEKGLSSLDDTAIKDMISRGLDKEGAIDESGKYTPEQIQGLVELRAKADEAGVSIEECINLLVRLGIIAGQPIDAGKTESVKKYAQAHSTLSERVTNYNEILTQTSEIVADNTAVTQEYKDSLIELGISEDELNECFDDNNKLVVKDARALNDLVKSAKKNTAQNIKLAKSYAMLDYYELYKEMRELTNGTKVADAATLEHINSLYDQMSVLEKTIAKYSLLEAKLLGSANAYDKLAEAQAADEATDYGSKAEELVNVLADAFSTSQLGTEAAQVAIAGLIPDDVIDKSKTLDEQMEQIHNYFKSGTLSKLFKIEYDDDGGISSVEMTKEKVEKFTKSLIGSAEDGAVFQGTWDEFTLNPAIETLEDFAKACGVTKEVAFAYLTELEKYDINWLGGDHTTLLDKLMGKDFEYKLYDTTQKLADLEKKIAEGTITDNERNTYNTLLTDMEALEEQAVENAISYSETSKALEETKTKMKDLNDELEEATNSEDGFSETGRSIEDIEKDLASAQEEADGLMRQLNKLDEPTEFTLQVAADEAQEQIDDFKKNLQELVEKDDKNAIKIQAAITEVDESGLDGLGLTKTANGWEGLANWDAYMSLDKDGKEEVEKYLDLINGKHTIDAMMGDGIATIEQHLQDIVDILQKTYDLQVEAKVDDSEVISFKNWLSQTKFGKTVTFTAQKIGDIFGWGSANGTAHANGTAYKSGSWGAPKTEEALVGELGPELRVRGNQWTLIGQNGAEFTDVQRGDIIFNHKQTESLLKNGYVTGRGKAYAHGTSGTAYALARESGVVGVVKAFATAAKEIAQQKKEIQKIKNIETKTSIASNKTNKSDTKNSINTFDPNPKSNGSTKKTGTSSSSGSSSDDFREIFDWIEVRLEEINESIELKNAKLENAIGSSKQNVIIDDLISLHQKLYDNLTAGAKEYYTYAENLLAKVPEEYREAAQDGAISIEEFVGKTDEKTLSAIQDYREWVQKGADLTQQAEETLAEISSLAKQAIDNIASDFENKKSLRDNKIDQYEAYNSLLETDIGYESAKIYQAMIAENNKNITTLEQQRAAMLAELNAHVEAGNIKRYSQDWYDAVNDIAAVDTEIIELKTDTEDWQDAINELHWEQFDSFISRLEAVSEEAENLIDILGNSDVADEVGNWTKEGITSLGLYAQQMEAAEMQAKQYQEEIDYLNGNWKKLGYTEQEYYEKLDELKDGQYDAIKAYHDTKDAIVDLNSERVDAIKEGIEKEIEAYSELIEKKKEELDAEQDLYNFQKNIKQSSKEIADIERQLAALSGDNSAAARAKRAQLQAELAEAKQNLEDQYYERSISNQQEALDKELENFQDAKDKEMESWDEYLENTNKVVADSLATIKSNTDVVYQTLKEMGQEYSLSITESLTSPWKDGENAIQSFSEKFGLTMSSTVKELEELETEFDSMVAKVETSGGSSVNTVNNNASGYTSAEYKEPVKSESTSSGDSSTTADTDTTNTSSNKTYPYGKASATSGNIKQGAKGKNVKAIQYALNQLGYGNSGTKNVDGIFGSGTTKAVKNFQKAMGISADGIVGNNTRKKFKAKGYSIGTTGIDEDQWAWVDELGEELIIRPQNGRLTFMEKGTGVVPADLTSNLMEWGTLDPQEMLNRNRPSIGMSPSVVNNTMEIKVDASVGTLLSVENFNGDDPAAVAKMINQALEKHTKNLNNSLKRFTR